MRYLKWLAKYTRQECRFLSLTLRTSLYRPDLPRKLRGLPKVCSEWQLHLMLLALFSFFFCLSEMLQTIYSWWSVWMHPFVSLCTGKYYYLPNASDAVISAATKTALTDLKGSWFWSMSNRSSTFWWAANLRLCSNCVAVFKAWWAFWLSSCDKFWCRSLPWEQKKKIWAWHFVKIECPLLSNVWQCWCAGPQGKLIKQVW